MFRSDCAERYAITKNEIKALLTMCFSGGHLKPDVYFNVPKYTALYGAKAAADLAKFESSQVLAIKEVVYKENIDCDYQLTRAVDVSLDQAHVDKSELEFNELVKNGAESVRDVHFTSKKYAEQVHGKRSTIH